VRASRILLIGLLASLAGAAPAGAAVPGGVMRHRVHDVVLAPGAVKARAAQAATRVFDDGHGRRIHLASEVPGLDLAPYARLLGGIPLHGREIEFVTVTVAAPDKVGAICGSSDAAACYGADDPGRSPRGHMYIPASDPDLKHIVTHEYGHHVDNQLLNLAGLGFGCDVDGDGSRRWFFTRDLEDGIYNRGYDCSPVTEWDHLLPELYAEDFARANGMTGWVLPVPPPSRNELGALRLDIAHPFRRSSSRSRVTLSRRGEARRRFTLAEWTALGVRLSVPRGRDYDLYLYSAGGHRPLVKSAHSGSADEHIGGAFMEPGSYTLVVRSRGAAGSGRLKLALR
jgi:hypothetical protein